MKNMSITLNTQPIRFFNRTDYGLFYIIKFMKFILAFLSFFLFSRALAADKLTLMTEDSCKIAAAENIVSTASYVALEIHGLGSTKEEWDKFNSYLSKENIGWLALDLRGHGESRECGGKPVNYESFTPADWPGITKDVSAGYRRLLEKFPPSKIVFAGASIGANASLIRGSRSKSRKLLLLSPGLNYAGLETRDALERARQNVLIVSSENDEYASFSADVFKTICEKKKLRCSFLRAGKGHGVQIFDGKEAPDLAKKITDWIKK
ncbi:MAG: hypothetical protein COT17_01840 [Elusimicrobia bacterium CG08_land_8_20_14_0_20_51_18]|nr:MAG: hypothetical protein COT17_01840 [Elusimicrobia bacterium CG08_land_8_20_14_0_20_51_18]